MKTALIGFLMTLIASSSAAQTAVEECKLPKATMVCVTEPEICLTRIVLRDGVTIADYLGAQQLDDWLRKNGMQGSGITPDCLLQVGEFVEVGYSTATDR